MAGDTHTPGRGNGNPEAGSSQLSSTELLRQVAKLNRINAALIDRVERSVDHQANAYALFQTAIGLEAQVRVRTDELNSALTRLEQANAELMAARDTAERANRLKTRFFTAVGHDLLQPLHAARLSLSALSERESTADNKKLAGQVDHALSTVEQLLRSILDISKLESGVLKPSTQSVSVSQLFASLAVDIEPLAHEKKLRLVCRAGNKSVLSDPLMLRRILQNFLVNAVHYTQAGGVALTARARGDSVRLEVWDTGPGIPITEQKRIFEEFERGTAAGHSAGTGFGLGLSIVRRMAETLDHPIEIASRLGHGSRFAVLVPAAQRDAPGETPPQSAGIDQAYGFSGTRVLAIDNNSYVLGAMKNLLSGWGCEVQTLAGPEAWSGAGGEPTLIIADYHLDRGQCGLDFVKDVRSRLRRQIAAIVVTADHSTAIADACRDADCALLHKPVQPAELRALMNYLVRNA
jgi:signal transduction histidine kinase